MKKKIDIVIKTLYTSKLYLNFPLFGNRYTIIKVVPKNKSTLYKREWFLYHLFIKSFMKNYYMYSKVKKLKVLLKL